MPFNLDKMASAIESKRKQIDDYRKKNQIGTFPKLEGLVKSPESLQDMIAKKKAKEQSNAQ